MLQNILIGTPIALLIRIQHTGGHAYLFGLSYTLHVPMLTVPSDDKDFPRLLLAQEAINQRILSFLAFGIVHQVNRVVFWGFAFGCDACLFAAPFIRSPRHPKTLVGAVGAAQHAVNFLLHVIGIGTEMNFVNHNQVVRVGVLWRLLVKALVCTDNKSMRRARPFVTFHHDVEVLPLNKPGL